MSSRFRRDNTNFRIALGMLEEIQKNGRPQDRESLRLWVCTLADMGYIRKDTGRYVITEKGREILHEHMLVSA